MLQIRNVISHDRSMLVSERPSGTSTANEALNEVVLRSIKGFYYDSSGVLTGYSRLSELNIERMAREAIWDTITELYTLLTWSTRWNSYDSCAPQYDAVMYADNWIVRLFLEVVDLRRKWIKPNVTASEDGEVVFEWWYGTKKLTIYVGEHAPILNDPVEPDNPAHAEIHTNPICDKNVFRRLKERLSQLANARPWEVEPPPLP